MCRVDEGKSPRRHRLLAGASAVALMSGMLVAETGQAAEFSFDNGTDIAFDTTIAVGVQVRVQDPDDKNVGFANGGRRYSINGDDGNLNYDAGLSALVGRVTHELSADYSDELIDFGLFTRVAYFYDIINAEESTDRFARTDRTPLGNQGLQRTGRNFEVFDAFLDFGTEIADRPVDLRVGRQTLNWGESTFIPNGLNVITPIDVTRLRSPGSEVRDALLPFGAVDLNVGIVDNLSMEGFFSVEFAERCSAPMTASFPMASSCSPASAIPPSRINRRPSSPCRAVRPVSGLWRPSTAGPPSPARLWDWWLNGRKTGNDPGSATSASPCGTSPKTSSAEPNWACTT